jgi:hypothetical protein
VRLGLSLEDIYFSKNLVHDDPDQFKHGPFIYKKNRINFNLHSSSLDRILFLLIAFLFAVAIDSLSELDSIILALLEADEIDIMSICLIGSSFRFLDIFQLDLQTNLTLSFDKFYFFLNL